MMVRGILGTLQASTLNSFNLLLHLQLSNIITSSPYTLFPLIQLLDPSQVPPPIPSSAITMSTLINPKTRLSRRAGPDWDVFAELSMLHLVELRSDSESSYDTYDLPPDVRELHTLLSLDLKTPCEVDPNPHSHDSFVKIGTGRRGDVFAQDRVAVKLCKTRNHAELWNEYVQHAKLAKQFAVHGAGDAVGVPAAHYFVPPATRGFFATRAGLAQAAEGTCPLPTSAFVMERIPPLPPRACALLMERFCAGKTLAEARRLRENDAYVVRVLLGSDGEKRRHWRKPRLRLCAALHLGDLVGLHLDVRALARAMGVAMAVMHWAAGTDARGVEFVLGSSRKTVSRAPEPRMLDRVPVMSNTGPETMRHEDFFHEVESTKLWVLDFDRVRPMGMDEEGVEQAVEAAVGNEPYLPRPLRETGDDKDVWAAFAVSYVEAARVILDGAAEEVTKLPVRFIQGLVEKEMKRKEMEKAMGEMVVFEGVVETTDEDEGSDDEERREREGVKERREARESEVARELEKMIMFEDVDEGVDGDEGVEGEERVEEEKEIEGEKGAEGEGEGDGGEVTLTMSWEAIAEEECRSVKEGGAKE